MRKQRKGHGGSLTIVSSHAARMTAEDWRTPERRFERLKGAALQKLLAAAEATKGGKAMGRRALFLLDYLLRVMEEPAIVSPLAFQTDRFRTLQLLFYGAMGSSKFMEGTESTRIGLAYGFYRLMRELSCQTDVALAEHHQGAATEVPIELIELFEDEGWVSNVVEKLRPFLLHSKTGVEYRVLLEGMVPVVGRGFTDELHQGLRQLAEKKAKDTNLRDFGTTFANFIARRASEGTAVTAEMLRDPWLVYEVIVDFMEYHFMKLTRRKAPARDSSLSSLQKVWTRYQNYWLQLAKLGVVARPTNAFPEGNPSLLRSNEVGHRRFALNEDGTSSLVTAKLIIAVPIHLTDEEATLFLFEKLRKEFNSVQSWLRDHLLVCFEDAAAGERLAASVGELPPLDELKATIAKAPKSERAMALAVKYFKDVHHGYVDTSCERSTVYPSGAARSSVPKIPLARYLGIPGRTEAMALMGYLASVDGRFSEAALSGCEIFDLQGRRTNAVETDSGMALSVFKERTQGDGWHHVVLKDESAEMLRRWLQLTGPLREYMKANQIDGWRRLFIYTGQPLGAPSHFGRSSNVNSFFKDFASAHADLLGGLAKQVSIAKIRSTRGVLRFLETMDIQRMAMELGNSAETSLRHYLPSALWEYFANRWLRIFQNLQIVEATRDTPYMQRALAFESADEMDQFLRTHVIRPLIPESVATPAVSARKLDSAVSEMLVAASPDILAALLSIAEAGRMARESGQTLSGHGLYWMEFADKLRAHIQSEAYADRAIKDMLKRAAANISPANFMEAVCA